MTNYKDKMINLIKYKFSENCVLINIIRSKRLQMVTNKRSIVLSYN